MHDPATLAFTVPGPWLRRDWDNRLRFGQLFDVWHYDPSKYDTTTCNLRTSHWKFHIYHYRVVFLPWHRFRRRYLTRCAECGKKDRTGRINVSRQWARPAEKWWLGEVGLYHATCMPER